MGQSGTELDNIMKRWTEKVDRKGWLIQFGTDPTSSSSRWDRYKVGQVPRWTCPKWDKVNQNDQHGPEIDKHGIKSEIKLKILKLYQE